MKRKQLAKRIAIAMLSAATVMTAAPVGVFAAETTSVEASNAVASATWSATKNGEAVDTSDAAASALKTALASATTAAGKDTNIAAFQTALESNSATLTAANQPFAGQTLTVTDTTFTAAATPADAAQSGSVTVVTSNNDTYVITFSKIDALNQQSDANDAALSVALDTFFDGSTFYTYDSKTITVAAVQKEIVDAIDADMTKGLGKAASDAGAVTSGTPTTAAGKWKVLTADVASDGQSVSGQLQVTTSTGTYYYNYKTNLVKNSDSQKDVVKTAISEVEKTSYANPINFTTGKAVADGGNSGELATAITAALNKQLEGTGKAVNPISGTVDKATRTSNGSFSANINGNNLSVTLKYGSAEKLDDQIKAVTKALKDQGAKDDATVFLADTTTSTNVASSALAKNYAYINNASNQVAGILKFNITTDFSKSVQPTTSLKAVKADDVKTAVLNAVNKAVSDAGYADDGVTYKAEVVSKFADRASAGGSAFQTTDGTQSATKGSSGTTGQYLIKVTGSIKNDYSSWKTSENTADEKTKEAVYYVVVDTNKLAEKNAESISLTDKTLAQKKEYTSNKKADGSALDSGTDVYADVYDLKAILKPEDTNDTIQWSVEPADDDTAATGARTELSDVDAHATLTKGTKVTFNAVDTTKDINKTDGKLIVFAPGKYKVTAKDIDTNDTAEATITIIDNFSDNKSSDSYYYIPVKWAYQKGVTAGVSGSEFGTNTTVTRGQFVTWLYNLAVANGATTAIKDADVVATYSDVPTTAYYAKAVQWAKAAGVAAGTGNGEFTPNKKISRAQALTMVYNYAGKPDTGASGRETENTTNFTDVKAGAYYLPAVTWAVNHSGRNDRDADGSRSYSYGLSQIASGKSVSTFDPEGDCTRAQSITFVYRAFAALDGTEVVR